MDCHGRLCAIYCCLVRSFTCLQKANEAVFLFSVPICPVSMDRQLCCEEATALARRRSDPDKPATAPPMLAVTGQLGNVMKAGNVRCKK